MKTSDTSPLQKDRERRREELRKLQAYPAMLEALRALLRHCEQETCTHEETYRGGAIWEICDRCGAKWADDEGGKPAFEWPAEIEAARAAIAQAEGKQP